MLALPVNTSPGMSHKEKQRMSNYMLVYRGGNGMASTPEAQAKIMAAWGAWYGTLGSAVVDGGTPFGDRTAVSPAGPTDPASALGGYTIVSAASLTEAAGLTAGCPVLDDGGTVDVYECVDMGA